MTTQLTLHQSVTLPSRRCVEALRKRLPDLEGRAIRIRFLPALSAARRQLYSKRTFGQPVYASPIVAAAQDIPGVEAVLLTRFGFLGPPGAPIPARIPKLLRLRPSEIARLDNDPEAPEHGYAVINLQGGR